MDLAAYDALPPEEQRSFVEFLLWHYRVVDAFWFIRCEEDFGLAKAEELNERVWGKTAQLGARELAKRFLKDSGLEGLDAFAKALSLFPWALIVGYDIEREGSGPAAPVSIKVPHCPAQEGRLKHGLGEYACKAMHMAEFRNFAQELDPRIRVECLYAPPDPHPEDCYCSWRFTLED